MYPVVGMLLPYKSCWDVKYECGGSMTWTNMINIVQENYTAISMSLFSKKNISFFSIGQIPVKDKLSTPQLRIKVNSIFKCNSLSFESLESYPKVTS